MSRMALRNITKLSTQLGKRFIHRYQTSERVTVPDSVVSVLSQVIGKENVSTAESVCQHHGKDESHFPMTPAGIVVSPGSVDEVVECTKICSAHRLPMIPFGTGTGVEGGIVPLKGGVTFDMMRMDRILDLYPEDFTVTVEPGVTRLSLNNYLRDTGLWFPIDPGADASLCGMTATSASGTNAVRYGTMRDNVLNIEAVLADGRLLHTAGPKMRAKKTSAGYNLTNLFVGSEGTLGFITKSTLKLYGIPETMVSAVCQFPDIQSAVDTTVNVLQAGIQMGRIELLDDVMMKACINYSQIDYEELPTLFLEFHGQESAIDSQIQAVEEISSMNGGQKFTWAREMEARNKLWKARHNVLYATQALRPGSRAWSTDVCVPLSKLTELVVATKADIVEAGVIGTIVGHVGDGNFHTILLVDHSDEEEYNKVHQLADTMAERAIAMGGTCTGEHGIGIGKRHHLVSEVGETGIDVMTQIKHTLDPLGLMNPGKVI